MNKSAILLITLLISSSPCLADEIDYSRQIRPILSKNCFTCHGHDAKHRKAKLRLDVRSEAIAARDGAVAVVPGSSIKSALYTHIVSKNPEERMPPADSGRELSRDEIELLRKWIDQGAKYAAHWAFTKPARPSMPKVNEKAWPKNALDYFVLNRHEREGLRPSREADRYTLIRRLSFDLTGLPPTPEQIRKFIEDRSPRAYEHLVDRLLSSPHYGERWARVWMDLARYADTQGYEKDSPRVVWPWRDWLIKALNDDMPYDQFTTEQIAGDLLPNANSQQILATVFHRNTMTNTEGGTSDEEFRVAAVKDRIDTTGLIWLGLSVGCAKCHSHKYDPISQIEYYQLFAFFNQTADSDRYDDNPRRALPSPFYFRQFPELIAQLEAVRKQIESSPETNESMLKQVAELEKQLEQQAMSKKPRSVPVMQALPQQRRRATRLLIKGDFLNPGTPVEAKVPDSLHGMPVGNASNRLGLAKWLMNKDNPLAARVAVNRVWSRLFGIGIVETEEDFGTQGELPTHPALLDWLATEFSDTHRWSQKKLCKTIVMSATYRQSSRVTPKLLKLDPRNRLLARGPRFRLEAEMIRDQALAVSGLLSRNLYGPPVMPPQPEGVWKTVYNSGKWTTSKGEDRYRRGLYTFAKRTAGYPSFLLLDAGSGEVCLPRRIRTNTVTAALATLNDPVFTEAAQALARRVVSHTAGDVHRRVAFAWSLATGRPPIEAETKRIVQLFNVQLHEFRKNEDAAIKTATVPLGDLPHGVDAAEAAAWTVVASVLLNLDEVLTKG